MFLRFSCQVESRKSMTLLVAGMRKDVQNLIIEGTNLVWESYKLDPYVGRYAESVVNFQEKVDDLLAGKNYIPVI